MKNSVGVFAAVILLFSVNINSKAQNRLDKADDLERIVLNSYLPEQEEELPPLAKKVLLNKLSRIATKYGMGGSNLNMRFIITSNVVELSKDLIAASPPMIALALEVTLYIGDGVDGIKFSSLSFDVKGVGSNDAEAYSSAFKQIRPADPEVRSFINSGKTRIVEYYNSNCDFIITDATSKSERKEYDAAIALLLTVPKVCKECFDKCHEVATSVYKTKLENECLEKIQASRAAKANKNWDEAVELLSGVIPDVSCYDESQAILKEISDHRCSEALEKAKSAWGEKNTQEAAYWLGQVSADSKCYGDAVALGDEIKSKVKQKEDREWDFELESSDKAADIQEITIKALQDIGANYNNSAEVVEHNLKGWW